MAKLPSAFNAEEHDDMADFAPIPAGTYHCKVKTSELKENSKQTGSFLSMQFEVIDGDYKGRILFTNMNIIHPSVTAVEIAEKELAAICKACGKINIDDTEVLHGEELMVKVVIKKATAGYAPSNECKNYEPVKGLAKPDKTSNGEVPVKSKRKISFD